MCRGVAAGSLWRAGVWFEFFEICGKVKGVWCSAFSPPCLVHHRGFRSKQEEYENIRYRCYACGHINAHGKGKDRLGSEGALRGEFFFFFSKLKLWSG